MLTFAARLFALSAVSLSACAPESDGDDPARVCESPVTMPDCTEYTAHAACGASAGCHVCVQNIDSEGNPVRWRALWSPASCGCAAPTLDARPRRDAGRADVPPLEQ